MQIKNLIQKIDYLQMAIESTEVVITQYGYNVLQPTLNYLREEKKTAVTELSTITNNIEVQHEEINRLSHI